MTLTVGLLIAIVIVLTVVVLVGGRAKQPEGRMRTWDCVDRASGEVTSVKMQYAGVHGNGCKCPKCSSPEKEALKENAEYFTQCKDEAAEVQKSLNDMCSGDKFEYAVNEYGAPGMTYKDYVASQSVDPQVIKNHSEFVEDRLKNTRQNATGRTYSPDSHDSYDPISWSGLRRPQAVPVCNPTQVPDVDYNLFTAKPKFTWSSD